MSPSERIELGNEVVKFIQARTDRGIGANGRPLPKHKGTKDNPSDGKYSLGYTQSKEFKAAGKSKSVVNILLSGRTLSALKLISHRPGNLLVGFTNGSEENAKADGNIRGTYGNSSPVQKGRDFLGITQSALNGLLKKVK